MSWLQIRDTAHSKGVGIGVTTVIVEGTIAKIVVIVTGTAVKRA